MPGRQSHGGPPAKKLRVKNNSKKRALDAFSIASHTNPDKIKIRQHRLGVQEGGNRPGKRRRDEDADENDGEEEVRSKKIKKGPAKGRFDELDIDAGSDSEGNEWKLGQVDSDDDSDLDSDEAFGESDEERFNGYAFSGSSKAKKKTPRTKDMNLDEDEDEESDSELEDGDLGEDAIDLATMLDMAEEEEREEAEASKPKRRVQEGSDSAEEDGDSEESDEESSASSADEDDETADPAKLAALQNLIANLPQGDESSRGQAKQRSDGASEYNTPSDFGIRSTNQTKLRPEDLGLSTISDPHIKKSLKFLEETPKGSSKKKVTERLEVPLAKRQQDRLDRSAAYDKSKETLNRWTDTVAHNRRADHLIFPLPDGDIASAHSNRQLVPTNLTKPFNELEATIQSILEESGLATADGKDDEDHIREFEELEANKLSVGEVKARRDQLRMARELLFREEAKAKRIKKIKSKSYRKVHRKQREKEERQNREALEEGGYVPSEDELEAQDRRRAEERMGARHRGSKWAKAMKETGQSAWNEDARSGVSEMARRDEELRKRIEGTAVRKEFENESEDSVSDSEDDVSEEDESAEQKRLLRKLDKFSDAPLLDESLPGAKLANMDFMRKADANRKKQNDAMVEEMRRELAGEDTPDEEDSDGDVGRRIFGPGSNKPQEKKQKSKIASEFEEPAGSEDDEAQAEIKLGGADNTRDTAKPTRSKSSGRPSKFNAPSISKNQVTSNPEGGAWSKVVSKSTTISDAEAKRRRHKKNDTIDVEELDLSKAALVATQPKSRKSSKKSITLEVDSDSDESHDENTVQLPYAIKDQELIKRAFAGADVVGDFEAEKKQTAEDEDEKTIDNTLPGWGSWVGDGLSKREKAKNKGRFLTKSEGIKAQNRKDAKLERVIINEKRVKKNVKYLASSLPHPFETKQQYERSLRLPLGPEWTTKETFQDATKPRILLKQGIITPMSKPLL
ncbi:Utp14-domain-containing protein [Hyaloscypha variabilis F]|uniref:Utp14-domain-containing protein n=1 Tax=Hyaloscypha variabilis (strain UAMH 11265 / GT02V1 / F) TaxID=1149755 RepID=A0A2J6S5V0_HYAVF|nr:Utp14-domain-containing protein [Hyaloscypha variabilis F]